MIHAGGVQCGFCTPGVLITSRALLDRNPDPSEEEISEALVGNLCRCTGYIRIIESIKEAARSQAVKV
jgi:carbon-monoxide dehydrogenase small subunit